MVHKPKPPTLENLRREATGCRDCPLWQLGTQTVFGEGHARAKLMLVGEQPGDVEDREGHPFVGPAGHLLDRCLADAGIDRAQTYLTNAVKHFKWEARGKRRFHSKPNRAEVRACNAWLLAEIGEVEPEGVVLLGSPAAQSLLGPSFKLLANRGRPVESPLAPLVVATIHPS